jgi:hypothetical protein
VGVLSQFILSSVYMVIVCVSALSSLEAADMEGVTNVMVQNIPTKLNDEDLQGSLRRWASLASSTLYPFPTQCEEGADTGHGQTHRG